MSDEFNLERFVRAQAPIYAQALAELVAGRKTSHWMWFVFPQLRGLGHSNAAHEYGISGIEEARAYLAHPLLGARLRECTNTVAALEGVTAERVFGYPDELKFRSSMTLFAQAASTADGCFRVALARYFAGAEDPRTRELLTSASRTSG
ncbi:MAG: DUF1810 domain-containing protein [Proteobacteria bacterium]|nr:DUF1810 domain-containing protein [Pseudomonadota bacterium]